MSKDKAQADRSLDRVRVLEIEEGCSDVRIGYRDPHERAASVPALGPFTPEQVADALTIYARLTSDEINYYLRPAERMTSQLGTYKLKGVAV